MKPTIIKISFSKRWVHETGTWEKAETVKGFDIYKDDQKEAWVNANEITAIKPIKNNSGEIVGSSLYGLKPGHLDRDDRHPDELMNHINGTSRSLETKKTGLCYPEYLFSRLLCVQYAKYANMEYDTLFEKIPALYKGFADSLYNDSNEAEYDCMEKYIQSVTFVRNEL